MVPCAHALVFVMGVNSVHMYKLGIDCLLASQSEDLLQLLSKNTGKLTIQTLDTTKLQASYSRKISRNVYIRHTHLSLVIMR